jgi:hypothetical protein
MREPTTPMPTPAIALFKVGSDVNNLVWVLSVVAALEAGL